MARRTAQDSSVVGKSGQSSGAYLQLRKEVRMQKTLRVGWCSGRHMGDIDAVEFSAAAADTVQPP